MGTEPPPQWSDPNALAGFSSDINYTEQQVSAFLRKEAGLSVSAIEQLGVGTDSVAFLVNQTWIFKFTRRREAIPYASAESYVLERLARESFPIAVPRVKYAGFIRREWPYIGYRVIPGVPGYRSGLDRRQRTQTGVLLADFLRALHAVEPAAEDRQALPEDRFGHDDLDDWIDEIESRIKGLVNAGVVQDPSDRLSVTSAARGCRLDNRVSIVHRDLTAKNMLFTDSLKGIVDWADARLATRRSIWKSLICFSRQNLAVLSGNATAMCRRRGGYWQDYALCTGLGSGSVRRRIGTIRPFTKKPGKLCSLSSKGLEFSSCGDCGSVGAHRGR